MSKKIKVEIPGWQAPFLFPPVLMALIGIVFGLYFVGEVVEPIWLKIVLGTLGILLHIGALALGILLLVAVGKSIDKDEKNGGKS